MAAATAAEAVVVLRVAGKLVTVVEVMEVAMAAAAATGVAAAKGEMAAVSKGKAGVVLAREIVVVAQAG